MRTLFIHPTDPTTEFLNSVYADYVGNEDVSVLEGTRIHHSELEEAIRNADRIVFLGHGTEYGLVELYRDDNGNPRNFNYVITSRDLQLFRDKEVLCIWCNANIFAERYDLNAFYTGMFVSEVDEAVNYCLPPSQEMIDASNNLFVNILSRCVFDDISSIRGIIDRGYIDNNNPIICFNRECMGLEPTSTAQSL